MLFLETFITYDDVVDAFVLQKHVPSLRIERGSIP